MVSAKNLVLSNQEDGSILTCRLRELAAGASLTVVGLDKAELASRLPPGMPSVLLLELSNIVGVPASLSVILDDLADLALTAWPAWPASPLAPWRRAADRLAAAGRRPRFSHRVAPETQFRALLPAAGSPILLFSLDAARADRAGPLISTLEWTCRHGAAAIALFPEPPFAEAPWDRVLHDAIIVPPEAPTPAHSRLVPSPAPGSGSAVERRMRSALAAHTDLAGLFENEVTLRLGPLGPTPRVDLLWAAGKVVVELDGPEHERATYAADRHRDYELLVAGYLVLRLTNAEVELDLARSLDKVRRVVNLRRGQA